MDINKNVCVCVTDRWPGTQASECQSEWRAAWWCVGRDPVRKTAGERILLDVYGHFIVYPMPGIWNKDDSLCQSHSQHM